MKSIALIILIFLFDKINSILRPLYIGEEKCILNDFYIKSNIIITFNITEGNLTLNNATNSTRFVVNIYTKKSKKLIKTYETSKTYGKFSFNVEKTGHYRTCFKSNNKEIFGNNNYIIFDFKTESNLDVMHNNNETANMKDLEKVNQKLSFLTDKVEQIENMQLLAKNVENNFSKNQITATKRIAWISILQIIIILGIGCYNVYAIRNAFKNKANMPF